MHTAGNTREISNTEGTSAVLIYSTFRNMLVLLLLYKYHGIQRRVNKLAVSTTDELYLSTTDEIFLLCTL